MTNVHPWGSSRIFLFFKPKEKNYDYSNEEKFDTKRVPEGC
jgi:hypothetical protein